MEAKVSGRDVPRATKVIAVIDSGIPRTHPKRLANSATINVTKPIKHRAIMKHGHPPPQCGGGIIAKKSFHPMLKRCMKPSNTEILSISPSSFFVGCNMHALINWEAMVASSSDSIFYNN